MKIRCAVNQAEALRRGIDAPKATVLIDIEPAVLSEYARDVIADKLVKGHDLTGFESFHLIRASKDEFLERVAGLDEELKNETERLRKKVSSMLQAALKKNAGEITFVVARLETNGKIECFESKLPDSIQGRCGFWPFWDIAPDYDELELRSNLKRKFFENAIGSALQLEETIPLVEQVSEKRAKDRAAAEKIARELLLSSDKVRLKMLGGVHEMPWTLEEYEKGKVAAWKLDALLSNEDEHPAWAFTVPSGSGLSKFVPVTNLSSAEIEPFLDALKQLPKGAEVWIKDDEMDAFLDRDDKKAFAAWREGGLGRFVFYESLAH